MNGLTQSYSFKERLLKCEPIDLGRFVVDLRERHLDTLEKEKKEKKTTQAVKPLPTSIKEKEIHWPKEPSPPPGKRKN